MLGFAGIITMTLILILGFSGILTGASIQEVKANWANRRCDVFVMFAAALFKPSTNTQSAYDFTKDNFHFCVKQNASQAASKAFSPLFAVFKQLMQISDFVNKLMVTFRIYLSNSVNGFSKILNERFYKFIGIFDRFRLGYIKLTQAYERINAMIVASMYQGISAIIFMNNMQAFIRKVIEIIVAILIVMVIFAFFLILPFTPVILPTMLALGIGGAEAFCLHPNTQIVLQDGSTRRIDTLTLGTLLSPDPKLNGVNSVDGILIADGTNTPLYNYKDILLSGTHRILTKSGWVTAKTIKTSIKTSKISDRLYILNTKHHYVPVKTHDEIVPVSDWEEVSDVSGQQAWLNFVEKTLNKNINQKHVKYMPSTIPLLGMDTIVCHEIYGWVPVHTINIGDFILDESNNPTRVIGTYIAKLPLLTHTTDFLSDGVWIRNDDEWVLYEDGVKEVNDDEIEVSSIFAYNLITVSGTFRVISNSNKYVVRDFTECGIDSIEGCYEVLDKVLQ